MTTTSSPQKLKLLVLSSTYPRWDDDWEPAFVHELSKRLTNDFEVTVLCPREKGSVRQEQREGVNVIRYRYAPNRWSTLVSNGGIAANLKSNTLKWLLVPLFMVCQTIATWRTIRQIRPDRIHCHWIIPQGICLQLVKMLSRVPPHLLTSHGGDLYSFGGKLSSCLKKTALRQANSITVVSRAMAQEARKIADKNLEVKVIPMGIDTENTFYPDEKVKRSDTEILFVGRLVEKKGLIYLLDAFQEILQSVPNSSLIIIGDGPERKTLEQKAATLRIQEQTFFKGSVPNRELPNYYRKAAVFVAPFIVAKNGDQEGLGLVVAEALCCGCPVVVSNLEATHDITELIINSTDVSSIMPKSPELISSEIKRIIMTPRPKNSLERGSELRKKLNWNEIARQYSATLESL